MSWMQRLKRLFHIDIEHRGVSGGTSRVIARIETPKLIDKILTHLAPLPRRFRAERLLAGHLAQLIECIRKLLAAGAEGSAQARAP